MADCIDDIIPKKGEILEAKGKDRLMFVVAEGEPLFFRVRDGPFFPTLRVLHKCELLASALPRHRFALVTDATSLQTRS